MTDLARTTTAHGGDRPAQVADLYQRYRLEHQRSYYRQRAADFRAARNQARITAAMFLVLASLAGALGGANVGGWRLWWAVAATTLAALASALTSYEAVLGFDRLSREYDRTIAALARVEAGFPDVPPPSGGSTAPAGAPGDAAVAPMMTAAGIASFVQQVEAVLLSEVDRWAKDTLTPPNREEGDSTD